MGLLVEGAWKDQWYDTKSSDGKFVRQDSMFRHTISNEDSAQYPPETGRYHLYVSLACPWAHRTLIPLTQTEFLKSYASQVWATMAEGQPSVEPTEDYSSTLSTDAVAANDSFYEIQPFKKRRI